MTPRPPIFVPDEPLPPYTFVPGLQPHPESDPAGHSFGKPRAAVAPLVPADWRASKPYLRGLDLFNAGFYWEAHVEWEALWLAAGRRGPVAEALRGLIHLAAAGVKHLAKNAAGVKSHARRAAQLWRGLGQEEGTFLGLGVREVIERAETVEREGWPAGPSPLVPSP